MAASSCQHSWRRTAKSDPRPSHPNPRRRRHRVCHCLQHEWLMTATAKRRKQTLLPVSLSLPSLLPSPDKTCLLAGGVGGKPPWPEGLPLKGARTKLSPSLSLSGKLSRLGPSQGQLELGPSEARGAQGATSAWPLPGCSPNCCFATALQLPLLLAVPGPNLSSQLLWHLCAWTPDALHSWKALAT